MEGPEQRPAARRSMQDLRGKASPAAVVAALGGVFFLVFGLWPFFDPRSFFDQVAHFEPYNAHFLHDIGAFQLGIGATLILALFWRRDALFVALTGAGLGAAFHSVAHFRDHGLGGEDSDPFVHATLAAVLLIAAVLRLAKSRTSEPRR